MTGAEAPNGKSPDATAPDGKAPDGRVPDAKAEGEWRSLDRRTVAATALLMSGTALTGAIPTTVGVAAGTSYALALAFVVPGVVAFVALSALAEEVRWRRTRYRVGSERVELHSGVFVRSRRSLPRDQVRTVDVSADPLQRLLGLVAVRVGTGQNAAETAGTLLLRPVSRDEAERLRGLLLDRSGAQLGQHDADEQASQVLAVGELGWIRYAPLSIRTPLLGLGVFGAVLQVSQWFGAENTLAGRVWDLITGLPLALAIALPLAVVLTTGLIGSLGLHVELWWRHRLAREVGGTLHIRRGLLTTRSVSIEERRLRGVEIVEPLGNRRLHAARLDTLAVGLDRAKEGPANQSKALLPLVPRGLAHRVAGQVLRTTISPTALPLTGHPRAARTRRLIWASGAPLAALTLYVGATFLLAGELGATSALVAAGVAIVIAAIAVGLALDAYSNLGHTLDDDYLVTRSGAVRRSTVALRRDAVLGWRVRQSPGQRRTGLVTLRASTAAGSGAYAIRDVDGRTGLQIATEITADLVQPFTDTDTDTDADADADADALREVS